MRVTDEDPLKTNENSPKESRAKSGAKSNNLTVSKTPESVIENQSTMVETKTSNQQHGLLNGTELQQPFQLNSNTSLRKSESNNEAQPDKQRRSEVQSAKKSRARDSVLPGTISNTTDRKA